MTTTPGRHWHHRRSAPTNRTGWLTLALVLSGLLAEAGCGSGGGATPGQTMDAAGATGREGGSGEAGQAGAGAQAGATGEAGQAGAGAQAGGAGGASQSAGGSSSGGRTAGSSGIVGGDQTTIIDAINAVRAAVSKPASYTGTWAPLPPVVWSDTVAASAQAWANNLASTQNCKLAHEDQNSYGENLAMGTNLTFKQAVDMWASEKDKYTWSPTYSMADFNAGSGHYTQLVWRKSTQVGCGSATCARAAVISCRFSPPGNVIGQAAF